MQCQFSCKNLIFSLIKRSLTYLDETYSHLTSTLWNLDRNQATFSMFVGKEECTAMKQNSLEHFKIPTLKINVT